MQVVLLGCLVGQEVIWGDRGVRTRLEMGSVGARYEDTAGNGDCVLEMSPRSAQGDGCRLVVIMAEGWTS